ncbi:MAG TPA: S41 family peptidase, partial [Xanthomonadales bacterium]|nr:S41 family peptidase [Xanthomonadales bacterium]
NRDELIEQTVSLMQEIYVFPEVAEKMADAIEQKNFRGEYNQITTLDELTQRLTEDLQAISHDKHLSIRSAPPPTPVPAGAPGPENGPHDHSRQLAAFRASNFGFRSVQILPGNIGYVDLRQFAPAEIAGPTAIAAMNFLANSSAIIFDLRQNGGGHPSMIQLISSYLFEERKHLNSFYIRREDKTEEFWTEESVSGPKMVNTPVYILTSAYTFSAAEEFTYNLKNMQRATIVGETTGGGAHPVDMHVLALGDGLYAQLSLPFGRAINPITGTNWEGTGIEPHIATSADQALEVAQLEILKTLSATAESDEQKFALNWAREELEFKLQGDEIQHVKLHEYAGDYGQRRIFEKEGRLYYQRGDGPQLELEAMAKPDLFHTGKRDDFRVQFVRDAGGAVIALKGLY